MNGIASTGSKTTGKPNIKGSFALKIAGSERSATVRIRECDA